MRNRRMFAVLLITGILVCGLIVRRHAVRTALLAPAAKENHRAIQIDANPDYTAAMKTLRREERRQRPQEGRN